MSPEVSFPRFAVGKATPGRRWRWLHRTSRIIQTVAVIHRLLGGTISSLSPYQVTPDMVFDDIAPRRDPKVSEKRRVRDTLLIQLRPLRTKKGVFPHLGVSLEKPSVFPPIPCFLLPDCRRCCAPYHAESCPAYLCNASRRTWARLVYVANTSGTQRP